MANNYSSTSFLIPCTNAQAKLIAWCVTKLEDMHKEAEDYEEMLAIVNAEPNTCEYLWQNIVNQLALCNYDEDAVLEDLERGSWGLGFMIAPEGESLWVTDNGEYFNSEGADQLIQLILNYFSPDAMVTYSVAETCSNRRIDEFGGYAVAVSKNHIEYISCWSWMQDQKQKFLSGEFGK